MSETPARYQSYSARYHYSRRALLALDCLREGRDHRYQPPCAKAIHSVFAHAGWTQSEVAQRLRVNVSTVRRWTRDAEDPEASPIPYATWRFLLLSSSTVPFEID